MTESTSGDSDELTFGSCHQSPAAERLRRLHVLASANSLQAGMREDGESLEQVGNRRAVDRGGGLLPQGEGPSARSVWHASKDEAIAAIRGASTPGKPHNHRKHSRGGSQHGSEATQGSGRAILDAVEPSHGE